MPTIIALAVLFLLVLNLHALVARKSSMLWTGIETSAFLLAQNIEALQHRVDELHVLLENLELEVLDTLQDRSESAEAYSEAHEYFLRDKMKGDEKQEHEGRERDESAD